MNMNTINDVDSLSDVQVIRMVIGSELSFKEIMDMNIVERQAFAHDCRESLRSGAVSPAVDMTVVPAK